MTKPLMKCGHAANAKDKDGNPVCVICFDGRGSDAAIVAEMPDLTGRLARCAYYGKTATGRNHEGDDCKRGEKCLCEKPSSTNLNKLGIFRAFT